jgi:hypothetical protein
MATCALARCGLLDSTPADAFAIDAYGADMLTKALHWGAISGLVLPRDRWAMLAKGDPILTRPARQSTERDRTWETIIGSLAASFASNVCIGEPDVTCTFRGTTFAVEAKVSYSLERLTDCIEEGFKQADGKADQSLVFVNLVNLYPIAAQLELSRARNDPDPDHLTTIMKDSVTRWVGTFALEGLASKLLKRSTRPVGVAFFVPMFLHTADIPAPFFYSHIGYSWSETSADADFIKSFLHACNDVLGFRPPAHAR